MLQDDDDHDEDAAPTVPDPIDLGYPITLPLDVALGETPLREIFANHGLTHDDYLRLRSNTQFIMEIKRIKDELAKEGASFKMKAKVQAEFMLKKSFQMVHDPATPAPVKADLIKSTVRWAGYEPKKDAEVAAGSNFQVNIILKDTA